MFSETITTSFCFAAALFGFGVVIVFGVAVLFTSLFQFDTHMDM